MGLFQWIESWPRRRLLTAGLGIVLAAALLAGGWLYARSERAAHMARRGIAQAEPQRWEGVPGVSVNPLGILPHTGGSEQAPDGSPVISGLMNCTYPSLYWAEHPEEWLTDNVVVGQLTFSRSEMQSLLGGEAASPGASLARQFLSVILNVVRGAESRSVDKAIEQAGAWLNAHYLKTSLTNAEIEQALNLVAGLETFNRGEAGPGACAGVPRAYLVSSPTPTLEPTPTAAPRQPLAAQAVLSGSTTISDRPEREADEESQHAEDQAEPVQAPPTAVPPAEEPPAPEPTSAPGVGSPPPAFPPGDAPGQDRGRGHGREKDKDEDKGKGKDKGNGKDKDKDSKGPKFKEKDDQFDKGPGPAGQDKDKGKDKDKDKDKNSPPKGRGKGKGD